MSRFTTRIAARRFVLVAFVATGLAAASISGCTPAEKPVATPAADARTVDAMGVDAKRSRLATSFPLEVPVAEGEVVRGETQGVSAWNYELVIDADSARVSEWYKSAYSNRGWTLMVGEDSTRPPMDLTFMKGTAQSRVVLSSAGTRTRVVGVLGVGTPVLQTQ